MAEADTTVSSYPIIIRGLPQSDYQKKKDVQALIENVMKECKPKGTDWLKTYTNRIYFPLSQGSFPSERKRSDDEEKFRDAVADFSDKEVSARCVEKLKNRSYDVANIREQVFTSVECIILRTRFEKMQYGDIETALDVLVKGSGVRIELKEQEVKLSGQKWQIDIAEQVIGRLLNHSKNKRASESRTDSSLIQPSVRDDASESAPTGKNNNSSGTDSDAAVEDQCDNKGRSKHNASKVGDSSASNPIIDDRRRNENEVTDSESTSIVFRAEVRGTRNTNNVGAAEDTERNIDKQLGANDEPVGDNTTTKKDLDDTMESRATTKNTGMKPNMTVAAGDATTVKKKDKRKSTETDSVDQTTSKAKEGKRTRDSASQAIDRNAKTEPVIVKDDTGNQCKQSQDGIGEDDKWLLIDIKTPYLMSTIEHNVSFDKELNDKLYEYCIKMNITGPEPMISGANMKHLEEVSEFVASNLIGPVNQDGSIEDSSDSIDTDGQESAPNHNFMSEIVHLDHNTVMYMMKCLHRDVTKITRNSKFNYKKSGDVAKVWFNAADQEEADGSLKKFVSLCENLQQTLWSEVFDLHDKAKTKLIKDEFEKLNFPAFVEIIPSSTKLRVTCESQLKGEVLALVHPPTRSKNRQLIDSTKQDTFGNESSAALMSSIDSPLGLVPSGYMLSGNTHVLVHKCDICKLSVDAIINAANSTLEHGGGIARAIARIAGDKLITEDRNIIRKCGYLRDSDVAVSDAGNLPCKKVIHAVGPRWPSWNNTANQQACLSVLGRTFQNVLHEAKLSGFKSIALPAISSGVFGVPKHNVARVMCEQISQFTKKHHVLNEIHLVDVHDDILEMISAEFESLSKQTGKLTSRMSQHIVLKNIKEALFDNSFGMTFNGKFDILIHEADITKLKVDVIVSASNPKLNLTSGVAKAIADASGADLKEECRSLVKKHKMFNIAEVIATTAGSLSASMVYHAVGPDVRGTWYKSAEQARRKYLNELEETFRNILWKAESNKIASIAFPPISAGQYGIPVDYAAEIMTRSILDNLNWNSTLKTVHIVDINDKVLCYIRREFANKTEQHPLQFLDKHETEMKISSIEKVPLTRSKSVSHQRKHGASGESANRRRSSSGVTTKTGSLSSEKPLVTSEVSEHHSSARGGPRRDKTEVIHSSSFRNKKGQAKRNDEGQTCSDPCAICLNDPVNPKMLSKCKHTFCTVCIDTTFVKCGPKCPCCGVLYGNLTGSQPTNGTMTVVRDSYRRLPGYESVGTIRITYLFPAGIQTAEHPDPGQKYTGINRTAFLPNNKEGNEVLDLLDQAFKARLVFTIGRSSTTGRDGQLTWNDIHHKTSLSGGPQAYGYPDPTYLQRVRQELADKGITKQKDAKRLSHVGQETQF